MRMKELKAPLPACLPACPQVLDAEEYDTLMRTKELKSGYREQHGELQMLRSEVDYMQQLVETCSTELVGEFNSWCGGWGGPY